MFRWPVGVAVFTVFLATVTGNGSITALAEQVYNVINVRTHLNQVAHSVSSSSRSRNAKVELVQNVILAKSKVPGRDGQYLELVDVDGQYVNNESAGPFQGTNWTGEFQLRVVNSNGEVQSKLSLPDNKFTQLLFMKKFHFHFAEYTADGNPDFTLGQYADSNGNWYRLFEIKPGGIVQLQTEPAPLFVSDFTYSPVFQRVKPDGFRIKYYDNEKAKWYQATYEWKSGRFMQSRLNKVSSSE